MIEDNFVDGLPNGAYQFLKRLSMSTLSHTTKLYAAKREGAVVASCLFGFVGMPAKLDCRPQINLEWMPDP
jgi:hypothetical protein